MTYGQQLQYLGTVTPTTGARWTYEQYVEYYLTSTTPNSALDRARANDALKGTTEWNPALMSVRQLAEQAAYYASIVPPDAPLVPFGSVWTTYQDEHGGATTIANNVGQAPYVVSTVNGGAVNAPPLQNPAGTPPPTNTSARVLNTTPLVIQTDIVDVKGSTADAVKNEVAPRGAPDDWSLVVWGIVGLAAGAAVRSTHRS